jgi:hypothetical protein
MLRPKSAGFGVFKSGIAEEVESSTVACRPESGLVGGVGKVEDKSASSSLELRVGKSINQFRSPRNSRTWKLRKVCVQ